LKKETSHSITFIYSKEAFDVRMSEEHTRSVTVKRTAKKKSGYKLSEEDGEYFIAEAPPKARVNVGDKVVGVNGIKADEFADDDDANDLIESIRIVAVPEDEIEEYEAAKEAEGNAQESDEEEESDVEEVYEEYDRSKAKGKKKGAGGDDGKKGKKKAAAETALALVSAEVSMVGSETILIFQRAVEYTKQSLSFCPNFLFIPPSRRTLIIATTAITTMRTFLRMKRAILCVRIVVLLLK
jgi:hypothetical protein